MVRMSLALALVTASLWCAPAEAEVNPPDISLDTLPVVYYGANWNRTQENIDVLARFQMVILMQEDGHCWATCCPDRFADGPQCGALHNATAIPGCNASCAQHASQAAVFARMKASAAQQKRRAGHAILYMNSVYLWPFDAASSQGKAVQLLDVHGEPHMESCDPGKRRRSCQWPISVLFLAFCTTFGGVQVFSLHTFGALTAMRRGARGSISFRTTSSMVQLTEYTTIATRQSHSGVPTQKLETTHV